MNNIAKGNEARITDEIKSVINRYQNTALTQVITFKALEMAISRILEDPEEDRRQPFDIVAALHDLKDSLRVLCFPDGGDEYDAWLQLMTW